MPYRRFSLLASTLLLLACGDPTATAEDAGRTADGGVAVPPPGDAGLVDAGADAGADAGPVPAARFTEVAASAGLGDFDHGGQAEIAALSLDDEGLLPFHTGALAVGDVDRDGWPDLFVTSLRGGGTLYRNLGNGTFEDATERLGLSVMEAATNGAAFADVNRDGFVDLYVTVISDPNEEEAVDHHYLFFQLPDGTFEDRAVQRNAGIRTPYLRAGTSIGVGDYDLDGYLDLHVNEWFDKGVLRPPHTRLLRNEGAARPGYFIDTTQTSGALSTDQSCWSGAQICKLTGFGSHFTDLDLDGWPDLIIIQDFGESRLYWNDGDGTFTEGTASAGVGTEENGMGSTVADWDGDGDLDWFVTSIGDNGLLCGDRPCSGGYTGNRFFRNEGDRTFTDITEELGVRHGGWGWGAAFFDPDLDGDIDLLMTNGYDIPAESWEDEWNVDPMRFWQRGEDGGLTELSEAAGFTSVGPGVGLVVWDYDRDGDRDVTILENLGGLLMYRNDQDLDHDWLRVRLEGRASNPEGLHARVRVQALPGGPFRVQEMGSLTHTYGQSERVVAFGFGRLLPRVATLEVRWPSGRVQTLTDVDTNQEILLVEPE